jgi:hypothetical protein
VKRWRGETRLTSTLNLHFDLGSHLSSFARFCAEHSKDLRGTFSEVHFSLIYLAATISPGAGVIVREFEVRDSSPVIGHIDVRGREFPEVLKSVLDVSTGASLIRIKRWNLETHSRLAEAKSGKGSSTQSGS